jgi:TrmH family RNA methyltransferase
MTAEIQSPQNQRIKDVIKLRQRSGRDKQQRFAIDGLREIGQAVAGNADVVEAFFCDDLCRSDGQQRLLASMRHASIRLTSISKPVWEKLTFGDRQDGILAVARQQHADWDAIPQVESPLIIVLESIEKPGNIGAVLRTADAAGVTAVILAEPLTDTYNPNAIRASLGAIFRVPVLSKDNEEIVSWLTRQDIQPLVARQKNANDFCQSTLTGPTAIILGNEARGVSPFWLDSQFPGICLPMKGQVDSLNVSNAAAILMYEAVRQRS